MDIATARAGGLSLSETSAIAPRDAEMKPNKQKNCTNFSPPTFRGRWIDWHRGHGCNLDDGKLRTSEGVAEIATLGGAK